MKYTDELYATENTMLPTDLEDHYFGPGAHLVFTRDLWRDAVLNRDTLQGYWGWVHHQITSWEPDQDDADMEAHYRERASAMHAYEEHKATLAKHDAVLQWLADEGAMIKNLLTQDGVRYTVAWPELGEEMADYFHSPTMAVQRAMLLAQQKDAPV